MITYFSIVNSTTINPSKLHNTQVQSMELQNQIYGTFYTHVKRTCCITGADSMHKTMHNILRNSPVEFNQSQLLLFGTNNPILQHFNIVAKTNTIALLYLSRKRIKKHYLLYFFIRQFYLWRLLQCIIYTHGQLTVNYKYNNLISKTFFFIN